MNSLHIIGNITRDPETRTTRDGKTVCSFTVAVNRRGGQESDFFRVSAWGKTAENCQQYLAKGRKVAVTGSVSVSTYQGNDGQTRASLEVMANEVEFLSPKNERGMVDKEPSKPKSDVNGYIEVEDDGLPF